MLNYIKYVIYYYIFVNKKVKNIINRDWTKKYYKSKYDLYIKKKD